MKSIRFLVTLFLAMFGMFSFSFAFAADTPAVNSVQVIEIVGKAVVASAPAADAAVTPVATSESFVLKKGETLWAYSVAHNLSRKDWPKYWEEVSLLSGIPHTDAAWRKLPVGTKITVPMSKSAIVAGEMKTLQAEVAALDAKIAATESLLQQATDRNFKLALTSLVLILLSFILLYVLMYAIWKLSAKKAEAERLAKELAEERKIPPAYPFPTGESMSEAKKCKDHCHCGDATQTSIKGENDSCGGCPSPDPTGTEATKNGGCCREKDPR